MTRPLRRGRAAEAGGRALRALARWLATTAAMLIIASIATYGLIALVPGDPAVSLAMAASGRIPEPAEVEAKRVELGLDRPLPERYLAWLGGAVQGDFGRSWTEPAPVADLLVPRVRATTTLGLVALALGLVLTVALGVLSAVSAGGLADQSIRLAAVAVASVPAFVLALLVVHWVVIRLHVGSVLADGTLRSVPLPAAVLATVIAAAWLRPFRAIMRDALAAPYVRVARARGRSSLDVALRVALPVALVEFLPFLGLGLGAMLGATVLVEFAFAWPGVGVAAVEAALRRDVPTIQAFTLLSVVAFRLAVDAIRGVGWIADPRRRGAHA